MNKRDSKTLQWLSISLYLGIIYATLGIGPSLWDRVNAFCGGYAVQTAYIFFAILFISYLINLIFIRKEKSISAYYYTTIMCGAFFLLNFYTKHPAEKIHLFEYFILGILVSKAFDVYRGKFTTRKVIAAIAFCALAGIIDESIQYFLPNRVFDMRDIAINLTSSLLAFLFVLKAGISKNN